MSIIKKILTEQNIPFTEVGENQYDIDEVGGNIIDGMSFSFFLHGNRTVRVSNEEVHLTDLVKAYATGFDEFAEAMKKYL